MAKPSRLAPAWRPGTLTRPIVSEYGGAVRFENIEEGVTVAKQVDEVTGLSTLVVITPKTRGGKIVMRPQIKLVNENGDDVKIAGTDHSVNISFPVGALITVRDTQQVAVGEVLARIPQESQKTRDITGVCRAWPSCSKPVRRRTPACWPTSPARSRSARTPRASSAWSSPTWKASATSS